MPLLSTQLLCSWDLVDGRSFSTGLEKSLTSVAVLGKELLLNAFSNDPKINNYLSVSGLLIWVQGGELPPCLGRVFSFLPAGDRWNNKYF